MVNSDLGVFKIAGYSRISVDDDQDRENTSIENQKAIIEDFVKKKFPNSILDFYEDRDKSGYTFEQRTGYQEMRPSLMNGSYSILVVKDFSRFSRRNSRGLVELEDLRDKGVRIISIGDCIDYPTDDDWMTIQFRFMMNEMPVTETSKKVKNVIKRRQSEGKWICGVPYGYKITNYKTMTFEVDLETAEVVKKIYELYLDGYGYKKIAGYLNENNIPTPTAIEKMRKDKAEIPNSIKPSKLWNVSTIHKLIGNDFYIGTLRQGKYTRSKINGGDKKTDESEHIVFEKNHEAIIDYKTFRIAMELKEKRTTSHYRGVQKNPNPYTGYLKCGDCGSPLVSRGVTRLAPSYICHTYHKIGLKGCTSHHIRCDFLDDMLKLYLKKIIDNSSEMIDKLNESIKKETTEVKNSEDTRKILEKELDNAYEELKATKKQRIRETMKNPDNIEIIEQAYEEIEIELSERIKGLKHQIDININKRNKIIEVNRVSKTAFDVFDDVLNKKELSKTDIAILLDKIIVYEDRLDIHLKSDIDQLLKIKTEELEDISVNFKFDTINTEHELVQKSTNQKDKVYSVNVLHSGSPSRILKVLLISLGITTLPKSSIRLTIPVAFKTIPPKTQVNQH